MAAAAPRVLVVGNYQPDEQYSMRLYARELVANLRTAGVRADAIEAPAAAALLTRGSARLGRIAGYIDKYLIFPALLRWRARRYDCVHIADHSNAPYARAVGRRPVIVTCHDLFAVQIMLGEVPGQAFGRSGRLLQRAVLASLKRAQHVACVSEHSAAELRRLTRTGAAVTVIPNALPPFFHPVPEADSARALETVGLDPQTPYLLHVGGNQFYKNRPGVVRAFARLAAEPAFANHRLVMAGKPADAPLAEALAGSPVRDRIDIVVAPSDEVVRALYNRASVLLFLSLLEGFGWPILEAQACGCPVVTTDAEPMRSVAGDGAVLTDPRDPEAVVRATTAALADAAAMRARGFANAARYRPEAIYTRYAALYRSVVDNDRG